MSTRTDISFTNQKITLRGWLYTPAQTTSAPCIIMTHGFSALKEHYLDRFAAYFAAAGMYVLVYDQRNFGDSDGDVRFEVDPAAQIQDMKCAIDFVQGLENIDADKIGLWGTSFSAGIALQVAAADKRVQCVVAQVPFVNGQFKHLQVTKPESWEKLRRKFAADQLARAQGHPPQMIPVVTKQPDKPAVMKQPEAYRFFTSIDKWQNQVTLRSVENAGWFEPDVAISPIPLLFIVADQDTVNATELALQAYEQAGLPKKLIMMAGDHFAPYIKEFAAAAAAACEWFSQYLI